MPLEHTLDVPDVFRPYSPAQLTRMVQTMAALAALGGTSRQVSPLDIARRVSIPEPVAKEALENLVSCGFAVHHRTDGRPDLNAYRIYA